MDTNVQQAIDKMAHGENITRVVNADPDTRARFSQEVWALGTNARTIDGTSNWVKDVSADNGHTSQVTFGRDASGNRVVTDVQDVLNNGLMKDIYDTPEQVQQAQAEARNRKATMPSGRSFQAVENTSAAPAGSSAAAPENGAKAAYIQCMDASAEGRKQGGSNLHVDAAVCAADSGYQISN